VSDTHQGAPEGLPPAILTDEDFEDLGLTIPLFMAPAGEAREYAGPGHCDLCLNEDAHCFALEGEAQVIAECAACEEEAALPVAARADAPCGACGASIPFPLPKTGRVRTCASCLMAGLVALPKQTERGRVGWAEALAGQTSEGWVVEPMALLELMRTPGFDTWSAPDAWLFCCERPMLYLGSRGSGGFSAGQLGSGRQRFLNTVAGAGAEGWIALNEGRAVACVFRCEQCGRERGVLDPQEDAREGE